LLAAATDGVFLEAIGIPVYGMPRDSRHAKVPGLWSPYCWGVLSWHFESDPLVPGCHTFLILHGIAETFGLDTELA
jgi:hypothetical protein